MKGDLVDMNKMKAVFVTGGSRGIGKACTKYLVGMGYKVAFTYFQSKGDAEALVEELSSALAKTACHGVSGGSNSEVAKPAEPSVCAVFADVRDPDSVSEAVAEGARLLGVSGFDGAVLSAGVSYIEPFDLSKGDHWDDILGTNVTGYANVIWEIMPHMIEEKNGAIVLLSSIWGGMGASCEVAYSASKGAVESMCKALAKELGPSNIRVNCVAPGIIDTDMNSELSDSDVADFLEAVPLGRMGKPEEVAYMVEFLLSGNSAYITGQVIRIDGGL